MSAALHLAQIEQIALYLGSPWKVNRLREPSSWSFEIIDGAGRGLYFRVDDQQFKVSGVFPRSHTVPYREDSLTIGINSTRPAKALAADIMRRLIPQYLAAYARAAQRYKAEQEKEERLQLIIQAFMRVSGGTVAQYSRAARTVYFEHGAAEFSRDEQITLELRKLTIAQAIQIAALLKKTDAE